MHSLMHCVQASGAWLVCGCDGVLVHASAYIWDNKYIL